MPGTKVTADQFRLEENEVAHVPTGARWTAYPGRHEPHLESLGTLGSVLKNGDDYRKDDVLPFALKLLRERPMKE
jgi:hypothetical protein